MSEALSKAKDILSLSSTQLKNEISKEHTVLGFFTCNTLEDCTIGFEKLFASITTSNIYPIEWALIVLKLLDWLRQYRWLIEGRSKQPLFSNILAPLIQYKVANANEINSINPSNSYLLLKTIGNDQGCVLYSATLIGDDRKRMISPQRINPSSIDELAGCLDSIIFMSNEWLSLTGNEFILDPDHYVAYSR